MFGSSAARTRLLASLFAAVALAACGGGGGDGGGGSTAPVPPAPPAPPPIVTTQTAMTSADDVVMTSALSSDGRTLYIGGSFTHVGALTGSFVPVDASTGALAPHPLVNGDIYQQLSDGAGGWYLSGTFTSVDTVAASGIVHILANGTRDPAFTFGVAAGVGAMALAGGKLYFADEDGLGAVDAASGADTGWKLGVAGWVYRMLSLKGVLYVGGDFVGVGGVERQHLAAIDEASGTLTAWNPAPDDANAIAEIDAITSDGTAIFVGGRFVSIGGQPRASVAALDPITAVALPWDPQLHASQGALVNSIVIDGATIYLGGGFDSVGGVARASVGAVSASTGAALPWDAGLNLGIYGSPFVGAVAVDGDTVFVAGNFFLPGSTATRRTGAFDKVTAAARPWLVANDNAPVTQMSVQGTQVVLSGNFSMLTSLVRHGLAAIDTATGLPTAWDPELVNPDGNAELYVDKLVVAGNTVYAAGSYEQVAGAARAGLAALDAGTGAALDWNPRNVGDVSTMAVSDTTLYVGGASLTAVGGQPRTGLAAFDLASGQLLPWAPQMVSIGALKGLIADDQTVYIGGAFTNVNGAARAGLAAVDAQSGATLPWDPQAISQTADYNVTDMTRLGGAIYVIGQFDYVGGQSRGGLAAIDAATGAVLPWAPTGLFAPGSIAASGDRIYVAADEGGGFPPAQAVFTFSASQDTIIDTNYVVEGAVYTMTVAANGIFFGGDFTSSVGAPSAQELALFSK